MFFLEICIMISWVHAQGNIFTLKYPFSQIWRASQFHWKLILNVPEHLCFKDIFNKGSVIPSLHYDSVCRAAPCFVAFPNFNITKFIIVTRRYGPLRYATLRGPTSSSCGGLWHSTEAFFALWGKKVVIMLFWAHFWQLLVSSSNLCNF